MKVVGGLMFAFGEGAAKRTLAGVIFGVGMAVGAVNFTVCRIHSSGRNPSAGNPRSFSCAAQGHVFQGASSLDTFAYSDVR